jgi:antitoxin MazE
LGVQNKTKMEGKVKKWGKSLGLRLPKALSTKAGITEGTDIELQIEGDKITIAPRLKKDYTLDELLSMVSEENVHYEIQTNGPLGNEIW